MAQAADQIDKHTIVARLSVSIYKMDDGQLLTILNLLENNTPSDGSEGVPIASSDKSDKDDSDMHRQMIIARLFVLINQLDKDTLLQRLRPFQHPNFRWVREYPRLACYLMVDFAAQGKAYRSCIRDISASGVFIETMDSFTSGQEIALCFTLSESNEMLPFKVKGRVTRVYSDGIGVQYENMSEYQRDIISALIGKG
jgi:Tfp pilus assembly protein PilZ